MRFFNGNSFPAATGFRSIDMTGSSTAAAKMFDTSSTTTTEEVLTNSIDSLYWTCGQLWIRLKTLLTDCACFICDGSMSCWDSNPN